MTEETSSVSELQGQARCLRCHIMGMTATAGSAHPGGSLSAADIVAALHFRILRHNPHDPQWEDRDRFVLSKGHAAPALYAALAESRPVAARRVIGGGCRGVRTGDEFV